MFALYRITMPDGQAYIGVSKDLPTRLRNHRRSKHPVGAAIRAAGFKNVRVQILAWGKRDYIYDLETRAIAMFETRYPKGLNVVAGGFGCRDPLPETIEKIRAGSVNRPNPYLAELNRSRRGQKRSAVSIGKTADAHRGMKRSLETRARMSQRAKLRIGPRGPYKRREQAVQWL